MTRSNRVLNRLVLLVLGLVAIGAGALVGGIGLPAVRDGLPSWRTPPSRLDLTGDVLWAIAGVALVVVVLALALAASRGRGGTAVAVRECSGPDTVVVNVDVLRDVVQHELADVHDVVSVAVDTYVVRRRSAAQVTVAVRRGGDAVAVRDAVAQAVDAVDRTLGRRIPVLVHLTGGVRAAIARPTRVR